METAGSYVANGIEAEKADQIAKAIDAYEKCIELQFERNHPYDRLATIYRKQGQYDNEIRVLEKAIWVFENVAYSLRGDVPNAQSGAKKPPIPFLKSHRSGNKKPPFRAKKATFGDFPGMVSSVFPTILSMVSSTLI